ncbi:MAG: glycosyltransferase family 39 protein [Tepidisphaeraceae bacterium]
MSDAPANPGPISRSHRVILCVVLAAAAFLRFYQIGGPSLWKDEIWSVEMAMGRGSVHDQLPPNVIRTDQPDLTGLPGAAPWWNVCTHLGGVTHPPLYFVVLRWWIDLFSNGAAATRSLSAIFSLAAILVFFNVCRFLHGPRIALLAAILMALAVAQIDFAQDARGYTLLILLGLCAIDLLLRIELQGVAIFRLAGLAICFAAAALTHYLAAGALPALVAYAAIRLPSRARRQTLTALAAGAILTLAAWIPLFITQSHTLPSLAPTFLREYRVSDHAKLTLFRIIGLPIEFLLGESGGESLARRAPNLVLAVFLLTMALPILRLAHRRDLLLWSLWMIGVIGFVAVLDLARQTTLIGYPRYTILASPAIYAVIAAFDWPRRKGLRDVLAIAFIAAAAIAAIDRIKSGATPLEDWRKLSHDLEANAAPDDLLVFANPDPWVSPGTWYMGLKYYAPASHHPWLILTAPPDPAILGQLHSRRCLWLIGPHREIQGPDLLPGWRGQLLISTTAGNACRMIPTDSRSSP